MLLFNWLQPLTQILAQQSVPFSAEVSTEKARKVQKPFLQTLLYAPRRCFWSWPMPYQTIYTRGRGSAY